MSVVILTEAPVTRKIVERLIDCHPLLHDQDIQLREPDDRYGVITRARAILLARREPVAVVADADQVDPEEDEEYNQRALMKHLIGKAAPLSEFRVLLFRPCTEVLLFRDETLRQALLPVEPSEEQLRRARRRPKRVLTELFSQSGEGPYPKALLRRLDRVDPSVLWNHRKFKRLESFLLRKVGLRPTAAHP
jgi:hypothetical protein